MEKVIIKKDIDENIKKLRLRVFVEEQGFKVEDELENDENRYLHCCLYKDNFLIAYARLIIEENKGHIQRVVVTKKHRGKGYGSKIMNVAEYLSRKNGCKKTYLHSQEQAVDFYKKNDYYVVGDSFYECGALHYLMEKDIYKI